jgi:D-threo-aldose 1-dehydrogenase
MKTNCIGSTGVRLTELTLGGAALGNLYAPITNDEAEGAVEAAWAAGIRSFDTAPHYGLGLSERRLGKALSQRPRDAFVISTKVGRLLVPNDLANGIDPHFAVPATHRRLWDFTADGVRRSVEDSLNRLGLDRIDILYLHDPDDHWSEAVGSAYPALAAMRAQGMVGAIGVGMNQSPMLAKFVVETDIDIIMLAGRFTLLDQSALNDVLPLCVERGVAVLNVGVFNSGLLATQNPQPGMRYDYAEAPANLLAKAKAIATICDRFGSSLPAAALQFGRSHPAIVSTAFGAGTPDQVRQNCSLLDAEIPPGLWEALAANGLLLPSIGQTASSGGHVG